MSQMWIYFFVLHSANTTFCTYRKEAVKGPLDLSEDVSVNIFKQKLDCVHLRALLGHDLLQRWNLPCTTYPGHGVLETAGTFCALYREIWKLEWTWQTWGVLNVGVFSVSKILIHRFCSQGVLVASGLLALNEGVMCMGYAMQRIWFLSRTGRWD